MCQRALKRSLYIAFTWSWTGFYFFSIHVFCLLFIFHLDGAGEQAGSLVTPHCQLWERVMAVLVLPVGLVGHRIGMQKLK